VTARLTKLLKRVSWQSHLLQGAKINISHVQEQLSNCRSQSKKQRAVPDLRHLKYQVIALDQSLQQEWNPTSDPDHHDAGEVGLRHSDRPMNTFPVVRQQPDRMKHATGRGPFPVLNKITPKKVGMLCNMGVNVLDYHLKIH
jgi:hypothetical protein